MCGNYYCFFWYNIIHREYLFFWFWLFQLYSSVPNKNLVVGNYNNYLDININSAGKYLNNSIKSVLQDNKEFEFINLSQKLEDYFN